MNTMTEIQRSILAVSSALAILLVALILRSAPGQAEKVPLAEAGLHFDAVSACQDAKMLAAGFPERGMGSDAAASAAGWIESRMERTGLEADQREFKAWIAGERVTGRNVVGIDRGESTEEIILIAHYDIPFHVREGAMDDASGVGVLLQLAEVFSREEQEKTLVFIASDGEEWGMLGARDYAEAHPDPGRVRAVISLDCVRLDNVDAIGVRGEGQFRGQAPLWLWMLAEDSIIQAGGKPESDGTFEQFISQAVNISSTDQGPFLSRGMPGINLGIGKKAGSLEKKIYHSVLDTSENLKPEFFEVYGKSAELMIRSLDELDYSTDNNPHYLRTGGRHRISRRGLLVMQLLLFIPLVLATGFQYYNLRINEDFPREILSEIVRLAALLLPWILALVSLYLLVWKNVIPRYELYPATPLDPFLREPNWKALGIIVSAGAVGWMGVWLVDRKGLLNFNGGGGDVPSFAVSKVVCLDILLTISIIALFLNGMGACLFLAPAALLWSWIEAGRKPARVAANLGLAAAGALPFVFLVLTIAKQLSLGPYVLWYLLLGTGYGMFSLPAVLIALAAGAVCVRLLRESFVSTGADEEKSTASPSGADA